MQNYHFFNTLCNTIPNKPQEKQYIKWNWDLADTRLDSWQLCSFRHKPGEKGFIFHKNVLAECKKSWSINVWCKKWRYAFRAVSQTFTKWIRACSPLTGTLEYTHHILNLWGKERWSEPVSCEKACQPELTYDWITQLLNLYQSVGSLAVWGAGSAKSTGLWQPALLSVPLLALQWLQSIIAQLQWHVLLSHLPAQLCLLMQGCLYL